MKPGKVFLSLVATTFVVVGCAKQDNVPAPTRAVNGLMAGGAPQFEVAYVSDQSQVKTLPQPTFVNTTDSLETIRASRQQAAENASNHDASSKEEPAEGGEVTEKKDTGKKKEGVLSSLGDKLKSAAKPTKKAEKPAVKKESPAAKAPAKPADKSKLSPGALKPKDEEKADEGSGEKPEKATEGNEGAEGDKAAEKADEEKPDEQAEGTDDREGREGDKPEGDQEKSEENGNGGGGNGGG